MFPELFKLTFRGGAGSEHRCILFKETKKGVFENQPARCELSRRCTGSSVLEERDEEVVTTEDPPLRAVRRATPTESTSKRWMEEHRRVEGGKGREDRKDG